MQNGVQPFIPTPPTGSDLFSVLLHWFIVAFLPFLGGVIKSFWVFMLGISFPLALFFFIGIIYCVEQLKAIRKREEEKYDKKTEPAFETNPEGDVLMAHRWELALTHVESANPNDWKQAILEADIILDDLLTKMGYRGESIGEKLKRVERGDMKSLDEAWEAHKIRNQVAHEGSSFALTQHEAKRVIQMYRKVFEEFYYI